MTITIDPEFQALIPPLSPEEREQLEANIKADGCRDPLVVWNGLLLDGHNRHEICTRLNIRFNTVSADLLDRDAAADWIDCNQLGRRNLTPDQRTLMLGRRYNRTKKSRGGDRGNQHTSNEAKVQNAPLPKSTAETIAKQHHVDPTTVKRAGQFATAAEKVKAVDPNIEKKIAAGTSQPRAAIVKAAQLIDRAPEKAKQILEGTKKAIDVVREEKEERREKRREENRQLIATSPQAASTSGAKFASIVIDPPWDWGDEGDVDQLGRARPTYGTMPLEEIKHLPVGDLADDDCHLYLWITNRSLPKGFELLDAWGFRYITCLTWCKPSFGMGNYFRGSTEQVLFGVRGSQPLKRKDVGTWFESPRGPKGHSSKPESFFELVESCSPGPHLEMFSRSSRAGWTAWGAEA